MRRKAKRGFAIASLVAATAAVCSAQLFSSSPPETRAKVIVLQGQVSVLRDSTPWVLNVGDTVQLQQVIVTGSDGFAQFQVSDGSTFNVYPNSNVVFRNSPGNLRDLIDVLVGRVKVHIQKWGGQPNPNTIRTPTAVISVRGTTFDVSVDDNDETTVVTVEEGIVDVRHALRPGNTKTLNAGDEIHVYRDQPLAKSVVDKGAVMQRVLGAVRDAVYTVMTNPTHAGSTTSGPTLPGETAPPPVPKGPPTGPPVPPGPPPH